MYITKNTRHPPHQTHFPRFFSNLGARLSSIPTRDPAVISKAPEVCGIGNKGVKIMNYVDLSGIYSIRDAAYVFGEIIINPPRLWILRTNKRPSTSFKAFRQVGSW